MWRDGRCDRCGQRTIASDPDQCRTWVTWCCAEHHWSICRLCIEAICQREYEHRHHYAGIKVCPTEENVIAGISLVAPLVTPART